jgi:hypothetical protein
LEIFMTESKPKPAAVLSILMLVSLSAFSDTILHHTPPFVPTGMVPLGDDRLLLWQDDGQAQIRDGNGEWSAVLHLPMQKVMQIEPEGSGFLALGAPVTPFGASLIVALDPAGRETERWSVAGVWDIKVTPHGRRAVTRTGLLPLLPQAVVGVEEPFPAWGGDQPEEPRFPPELLYWQGGMIFCHRADLSLQHFAHARCERPGPAGWIYEDGESTLTPVACGPWLLVNEGKRQEQLVVLEMATGKVLARRNYPSRPRIACAGGEELAVGDRNLELVQLPSLKSRWHFPIAKDRVIELIALEHYLAYRGENSPDLLLVPRPALENQ